MFGSTTSSAPLDFTAAMERIDQVKRGEIEMGSKLPPQEGGRPRNSEPGVDFPPKKVIDYGDGTSLYRFEWNDQEGDRHAVVLLVQTPERGKSTGRPSSRKVNKVFTPKSRKSGDSVISEVPFNGADGERLTALATFAVIDGVLTVSIGEAVPEDAVKEETEETETEVEV